MASPRSTVRTVFGVYNIMDDLGKLWLKPDGATGKSFVFCAGDHRGVCWFFPLSSPGRF